MADSFSQPNAREPSGGFPARFWLLVALTGLGAGLGASALMKLLRAVQHLSWHYSVGDLLDAVRHTTPTHRVLVVAAAGLVAGVGRRLLRRTNKGHAGDLAQALWFESGQIPAARTLLSAVVSIVIVGMGASLGREGALKKTGATVAARLADWSGLSRAERRLLVACGAGAGIAAAYNVPFGGALFALEVLLDTLVLPQVLPALLASLLATAVSWVFLSDRPTYTIPALGAPPTLLAWAAATGPLIGLASVGYIRLVAWADALQPRGWRAVAAPLAVFTVLGAGAIPFPPLLGNGKDLVQEVFGAQTGPSLAAMLLPLKLAAILGCLGCGAPGGLFTPTLTCGALLGAGLGGLWEHWWPGAVPGSYAVLGAGAVLAAATQGPVSAVVLVLELTRQVDSSMVPLLLVVVGASVAARPLEPRSIYTARLAPGKAAPEKPRRERPTAAGLPLSDNYVVVSAATPYASLLRQVLAHPDRDCPIYLVDDKARFIGAIPRPALFADNDPAVPLETVVAHDLIQAVPCLTSDLSCAQAAARFEETHADHLPMVDKDSGRLFGIARRVRG